MFYFYVPFIYCCKLFNGYSSNNIVIVVKSYHPNETSQLAARGWFWKRFNSQNFYLQEV